MECLLNGREHLLVLACAAEAVSVRRRSVRRRIKRHDLISCAAPCQLSAARQVNEASTETEGDMLGQLAVVRRRAVEARCSTALAWRTVTRTRCGEIRVTAEVVRVGNFEA